MTPEEIAREWTNVNRVMELVKQEGDANCERAFDFLLAALAASEQRGKGPEACPVCWTISWVPIESEEDCEFTDHPHEGHHIRCDMCSTIHAYTDLRAQLQASEREATRLREALLLLLETKQTGYGHGNVTDEWFAASAKAHAALAPEAGG